MPFLRHRDDELLVLARERPGTGLRQVDRDALLQDRRGHHEDDQQDQHHVDQRRDVDLRHRAARRAVPVKGHLYPPNPRHFRKWRSAMFRNSEEKLSMSVCSTRTSRLKWLKRDHRRDGGGEPDGGGDQRLGDARARPPGCSRSARVESPRKAFMMPHTVPNRPMNGAVDGGRREERQRLLELGDLLVGRAPHRPLDVRRAAELDLGSRRARRACCRASAGPAPGSRRGTPARRDSA